MGRETSRRFVHLDSTDNIRDPTVRSGLSTMREFKDVDLVVLAQEGNSDAFAELYRRYSDGVVAYCARLLGNHEAANDVLQASFLKALDQLASLRKPEAFRAWLFQIARNEAFMNLRQTRGNGEIQLDEVVEEATPLERLVELEAVQIAETLLSALKLEYREVLVLREYENLSYAEIAEITGDSVSSVKARIFKARRAMVQRYQVLFERGKP
jgi:RNA polymerase sigma-70 factor (ECF subfamily)